MDVIEEGILSSGGSLPNFISHLSVQRSLSPLDPHTACLEPVCPLILSGLSRQQLMLGSGVSLVDTEGRPQAPELMWAGGQVPLGGMWPTHLRRTLTRPWCSGNASWGRGEVPPWLPVLAQRMLVGNTGLLLCFEMGSHLVTPRLASDS